MKQSTRILSLILALVLLVSAFPFTNASAEVLQTKLNNCWEFIAQKTIPVYMNANLSARGTSNPVKHYDAYAAPGDVCYVYFIDGNSAGIGYPTPNGLRFGYAPVEDVLGCTKPSEKNTSHSKVTTYKTPGGDSYGYISEGDPVWKLYQIGDYVCVVYPAQKDNRTHKIAFVKLDEYNDEIRTASKSSNGSILSSSEIQSAASQYGIGSNTNAYKALESINTKYGSKVSGSALVFLFEGVGNSSSAGERKNAMCVVVKNGKVAYLNRNCSTIPDYPFNPAKNGGDDMPTIKSGVYNFSTVNHKKEYAALNVASASVVRFSSKTSFYDSTSYGINVHRRSTDTIASASVTWVNSAGCQLVGASGKGSTDEYARFIQAVGIVGSNARGDAKYTNSVSGKIVIDRTYAADYLAAVGYTSEAIARIG